jgi:RsiW-degrading membrane proteinase PrsW (M82 family)
MNLTDLTVSSYTVEDHESCVIRPKIGIHTQSLYPVGHVALSMLLTCRVCNVTISSKGGLSMDETPSAPSRFDDHAQSLWLADIVTIGLLIGFVVLIYIFELLLSPQFGSSALLAAGIVLTLVPALLWLWFFYRRDVAEPEPRGMVLGVFVLGALIAAAIGIPLVQSVFRVSDWMYANQPWSYIVAAILVIGFVQQFLVYASVRFSVFNSAEFDGPTDGIIYATAAGLGYATVLNMRFITGDGATSLTLAAIQVVLTTLAMASFAGIVGYFLGREKYEERPVWWMTAGVALAALFNGVFIVLRGQLTGGTSTAAPANNWLSLLLAAVLAIATALVLSWLMRRDVRRAMAAQGA